MAFMCEMRFVLITMVFVVFIKGGFFFADASELLSSSKSASQTDIKHNGDPSRAVDGNTDTDWSSGSCTLTDTKSGSWWEVDLGQIYTIENVTIYGRTDCCANRLRNVKLLVGKSNEDYTQQDYYDGALPTPSYTFEMTSLVYGRWIRITRSADVDKPLTLCEVQVFGYPIDDEECDTTDLCNQGSCSNTGDSFSCICHKGWKGTWCDEPPFRLYCFKTDEFGPRAVFRFRAYDNSINGLQAYDPTIDPRIAASEGYDDPECITQTRESSGVYQLSILTNQCGSMSKKRVRVLGTYDYFDLDCTNGGTTIPNDMSDMVAVTADPIVGHHHVYPNPFDIKCMVFAASGWNAPVWEATYGQDLKLRCIYNKGKLGSGRDNWGKSFHIAFPTHAAATYIGFEIYTSELGTRVQIVGELSGYAIDEKVYVKRDSAYRSNTIPLQYGETSSAKNSWLIEERGIKIVSLDERIGVRVISYSDTNQHGSSYTALPDDVLGKKYLTADLESPADEDVEVVIIAIEDNTDITITYNGFNVVTLITVGTTSVNTGSDTSTTVTINEGETLSVMCDTDCFELEIEGTKEVGAVFGLDDKAHDDGGNKGHIMTQLTPVENYGEEFVFSSTIAGSSTPNWRDESLTVPSGVGGVSIVFASPISMYLHTSGGTEDPVLLTIPARSQWGINYYFYARYGATYTVVFIGKHLDSIAFTTGSVTTDLVGTLLSDQPGYVATPVVYTSVQPEYSSYELIVQITDNGYGTNAGLIEFKAEEKWKPFLLYILESRDGHTEAYLPMGIRWTLSPAYCKTTDYVRPDDGLDNDCDGYTDEEIQNGFNDDNDNYEDEDVTSHNVHGATGVYAHRVKVCDGEDSECLVIYDGCYNDSYDDIRGKNSYLKMEPFEHNVNLADEFDHLWVIDTPAFYAWRPLTPANDGAITITVFYGMCFGDLTLCEDSCIEKRSTDDEGAWAVSTRIPFHWNNTQHRGNTDKESETTDDVTSHPCSGNPVFWIPVSMLLSIVLIATLATVFFLYKRSQFIRRIQNVKNFEFNYQSRKKD